MKNLIIGSDGFVGKPLCKYLESCGEDIVKMDIKRGIQQDCRYANLELDGIDRVYFLAWDVGGAKYLYNKDVQLQQINHNTLLMQNVFSQLQGRDIQSLFISTQLAVNVDTVYGATKRLGEVWSRELNGVAVRLWNVYGSPETINVKSHVVSDFVNQAITNGEIHMMSTGEEYRQFIHTDDVVRGFKHALDINHTTSICDVTSFEWVTIKKMAQIIADYTGAKLFYGKEQSYSEFTPISGKLPNWNPTVSLETGLIRMVDTMRG